LSIDKCYRCGSANSILCLIEKFSNRSCGHLLCLQCGLSFDSDIDVVLEQKLTTDAIVAIENDQHYRKHFVETSITQENGQEYASYGWEKQSDLKSGIVKEVVEAMDGQFDRNDALKILDVGSGSGFTSIELATIFSNSYIESIDPSPQVLLSDNFSGRVTARQGTLQSLTIEDNSFDVVVIIGNLMLHANPVDTLERVNRLLKKDGLLIIDFKNLRSSIRQICIFLAKHKLHKLIPFPLCNF